MANKASDSVRAAVGPVWTTPLTAVVTALVAFVVYVTTLAPTVTAEDSGELITAAYTLGIPHPPGYPLWCLLAKLFTYIPVGTVAWRVGLLSATLGAATVAVICLIVIRLTRNPFAGLAAGLVFAFSDVFWAQCVIAEVYTLNSVLIAGCVLLLLVWQENRQPKYLYAFAAVYGLGLCNHHTMHFLGPMFAAFILLAQYQQERVSLRSASAALTAILKKNTFTYLRLLIIAFVVWFVIHLYLPIRSLANPPIDWGNPETWGNFWFHVLRRVYKYGFIDKPQSIVRTLQQTGAVLQVYAQQFTWALALIPLAGVYALWKKDRLRLFLIAGSALYILAGFIYILNFNPIKRDIYINGVFFIPVFMMAAILVGAGVHWLIQFIGCGKVYTAVSAALCVVLPAMPLVAHYEANDKSNYYFAYDYAVNIFRTLDSDAIYFSSADHLSFPLMYLQEVEKVRPDVTLANVYGKPDEKLYQEMPDRIRAEIATMPNAYDAASIEDWIIDKTHRPVYFTSERPIQNPVGARMLATGLIYKVFRPGEPDPAPINYWDHYAWHTLDENEIRNDSLATYILSDYHVAKGRELIEKGNPKGGIDELMKAAEIAKERTDLLNNIGTICGNYALFEPAIVCYRAALKLDPVSRLTTWNLAIMLNMVGQAQEARVHLENLIEREENAFGRNAARLAPYLNDYAGTMIALEDYEAAKKIGVRALELDKAAFGMDHLYVARDLSNLAVILSKLGDNQNAAQYQSQAIDVFTQRCGPDHELTRFARKGQFIPSMCIRMNVE